MLRRTIRGCVEKEVVPQVAAWEEGLERSGNGRASWGCSGSSFP
jgi:hypothetical protein